jgi:RNA polymerase sigma-70 factor (ECF subfamily)
MERKQRLWTETELQAAICSASGERDEALQHLFLHQDWLNMVRSYVLAHGGREEDGEDVFQDTFVLFDRNLRQGRFNGQCTLRTYFFAIAKWHWVSVRRKQRPMLELDGQKHDDKVENADAQLVSDDHRNILHHALSQMGAKCKELLLLSGIASSNEEIAREKGFSSAEMAKKELYRCREKFRERIKNSPNLEAVLKSIIGK